MHYTLKEDELNALLSVRLQLFMVHDLMAKIDARREIAEDGLMEFLGAQSSTLAGILVDVEERGVERPDPVAAPALTPSAAATDMAPDVLVDMLRAAAGEDLGSDRLVEVTSALRTAIANGHKNYEAAYYALEAILNERGLVWTVTKDAGSIKMAYVPRERAAAAVGPKGKKAPRPPRRRERLAEASLRA